MSKNNIIKPTTDPSQDVIVIGRKRYFIRFTAKHAEHIGDNHKDPAHGIKHNEIQSLIKKSPVIVVDRKFYIILGKFKNNIYSTYVLLRKDCIEVITSYKCSNPTLILLHNDHA